MKRKLAFILVLLTMSSLLIACAGDGTTSGGGDTDAAQAETTTAAETIAPENVFELEAKNWEGREFRVLGRTENANTQFNNFEIDAEEMNGEIVNDAVFQRNSDIMERYGVDVVNVSTADPKAQAQKLVGAGEDGFEVTFVKQTDINSLAAGGYFVDMYELDYIDWSKSWWNEEVNEAISIDGRLYFTTSSFNVMDKNRMYILVFNKDMAEDYSLGNMYEIVYDGAFTVDKAIESSKAVASDLDGDGVMTDQDRYGWVQDSYNASLAAWQSMDNWVATKDENDIPVIGINNEKAVASVDKMLELTCDLETSLSCEMFNGKVDYSHWSVSGKVFKGGNALFITSFINYPGGLKTYSADCDFAYGVLPFPKYDENQENYVSTPDKAWGTLFAVPKTSGDLDFVGYMLEVLSYTTKEQVMPAYYETSTKGKYTYDEESAHMLDMIFQNPRYDLGVIFDWGYVGTLPYNIAMKDGENTFASRYASIADSAQIKLEETIEIFAGIE